ncbi:lamin tail domain-containing protein [Roseofilum casamattae]|uniref:Lamin tail domain-containing protein n=1 Tax=Roseofilum casamattae BLCC-M143 TaxID=3022442 RepID=A0ABT7C3Z2_9CYAN|nr:lamin tail domain-containing protein [Roseofilum casamattae]MDJ1185569.1 lamin tail domain-containing protein [Roseofilum casamattae BLCC-M143]
MNQRSELVFDGNDYVATTLDAQPSALPATTWEAWVKPTRNMNHWDTILSTDDGHWDRAVASNAGRFRIFHGSGAWDAVAADINQWQHIAVVYTADKHIKFYKNGTEYVYPEQSSIGSTKHRFFIGWIKGTAHYFQGSIAEVRIWNYAREQAEIQRDMNNSLEGEESGLVGYWPLDEGEGTQAADRSGSGYDGKIDGATWKTSDLQLTPVKPEVVIATISYKGEVKRTQSDEYIEISNQGNGAADISGWKVTSNGKNQEFVFPAGTSLAGGKSFRVYTNEVHEESGGFSFGSKTAIWNDKGDTGKLFDAEGNEVSSYSYEG